MKLIFRDIKFRNLQLKKYLKSSYFWKYNFRNNQFQDGIFKLNRKNEKCVLLSIPVLKNILGKN